MNNNSGHIYVLINYSMENLIKIGKTSREPEERARELSSATGVPTPFIVAYDAFFNDCSEAENYIHNKLEHLGYRLSSNREFFQVPLKEVIAIIFEAQHTLNSHQSTEDDPRNQEDRTFTEQRAPWNDSEELAEYYLDSNKHMEAYKLFKQALKEGSNTAYYWVGIMTLYGWGCIEDKKEAIDYFKKGAKFNDIRCYGQLARLSHEVSIPKSTMELQQHPKLEKYEWTEMKACKTWFEKYLNHDDFFTPHDGRASNIIYYLLFSTSFSYNRLIIEDILYKYNNELSPIKEELIEYIVNIKDTYDDELKQVLLEMGKSFKKLL